MTTTRRKTAVVLLGLALLAGTSLYASMVRMMDLGELCSRAGMIFRGTVIEVTAGTLELGGGELPTVTYRVRVDEAFKGDFSDVKDGVAYVDVRMVGAVKDLPDGNLRRFSKLPELPQLEPGQEYVLMTTTPGPTGLSTTVGIGQGCFDLFYEDKVKMAVNELRNQGLYDGPVAYNQLADDIRAHLAP